MDRVGSKRWAFPDDVLRVLKECDPNDVLGGGYLEQKELADLVLFLQRKNYASKVSCRG
jgi:hypothetical protein